MIKNAYDRYDIGVRCSMNIVVMKRNLIEAGTECTYVRYCQDGGK